jgi:hypothetical protein
MICIKMSVNAFSVIPVIHSAQQCCICSRKKQAKLQKELEEAAKDTRTISPDRLKDVGAAGAFFATSVPNRALVKFVSILLLAVRFYV